MGWVSMVQRGDTVATPHGEGTVRAVSGNGSAQVDVNGQLFEVQAGEMREPTGAQSTAMQQEYNVGDYVQMSEGAGPFAGEIRKIRSKEIQPNGEYLYTATEINANGEEGTKYTSRRKASEFTPAQAPGTPTNNQPNQEPKPMAEPVNKDTIKAGDRVKAKSGLTGTVEQVTQRSVKVKFDEGQRRSYEKRTVEQYLEKAQEAEYKVGDRVESTISVGPFLKEGMQGTITSAEGNVIAAKWDEANGMGWGEDDAEWSVMTSEVKPVAPEQQEPEQQQAPDTIAKTGDGLAEIFQLKQYMEKQVNTKLDEELKELKELAKKNQSLEIKVGDKTNVIKGIKHKQLEQLINYAALRLSPLLVGMAGTGKTHAGEQTAEALGLPFYSMSVGAQTSKSDIIGYMDASGKYVKTHFRDAYENGGVFLMDEIDAGNANVLIQVNAALSNGLCAFPDAMVKRHEDFVFIASANTFGNGANRQYVGRNQLDAATLDRFAMIEWFIDDDLEKSLAVGINGNAWYMAVKAARDYVAEKNIRALVSPRATQKGSKLLDVGQPVDEVIRATLLGSVPEDKKADVTQVATTIFEKFASKVPSQLPKTNVADLFRDEPVAEAVAF